MSRFHVDPNGDVWLIGAPADKYFQPETARMSDREQAIKVSIKDLLVTAAEVTADRIIHMEWK